ncbi:hypothetical protein ACKFKF_11760 [Phormidesmis sp. 146-12]
MKTKLTIVGLMSLGIVAIAQPIFAQTAPAATTIDPFKDTQSSDALSNLFNNRSDSTGATTGVFDLIQRITSGTNQGDFRAQQQQNLDDAAAQFRAQQQKLLRQQPIAPSTQAVPSVTTPATP